VLFFYSVVAIKYFVNLFLICNKFSYTQIHTDTVRKHIRFKRENEYIWETRPSFVFYAGL